MTESVLTHPTPTRSSAHPDDPRQRWAAWMRYQAPYAAFAYAYFPITLTKRVLLRPRRADQDLMVRRFWDRWGWLPTELESFNGTAPLWVHMNSGGEVIMAQSLLSELEASGAPYYCSSDSSDAQRLLREWVGPRRVFFPPWDTSVPVARVLRRVRPSALIFVHNAYFPTLLSVARQQGIRTLLVNAVLSRNVHVANPWLARSIALGGYRALDGVAVQSEADYEAFRGLGIPSERLEVTGQLEGDLAHLRLSASDRLALRQRLGLSEKDRVLLAGSTHPAEVPVLLEAFGIIRQTLRDARLVLVPRWIRDADTMADASRAREWRVSRRTAVGAQAPLQPMPYDVMVVDTFGELRRLYGMADAAFIGASLVPINARRGGHNVLEPLAHGVVPLFGPHMELWRPATGPLLRAWSGLGVDSAATLAARAVEVMTGSGPLEEIRRVGSSLIQQESGAVNRTLAFVRHWTQVTDG